MQLILLFSHKLTTKQIEDAQNSLGVDNFLYLPKELQTIWSNIPSDIHDILPYLAPIKKYLQESSNDGDYLLIQGDFGATYHMVNFAKSSSLTPIYSTNSRQSVEKMVNEKVVKQSIFVHQIYRTYE